MRINLLLLPFLTMILAASGCANGRTPVYPTEGKLLINGEPAANVFVLFHPVDSKPDSLRPSATTDNEGKFRLTSHEAYDGGPAGDYKVTLLYEPVNSPLMRPKGKPPQIPVTYTKPQSSPLRAKIEAQPKNEIAPLAIP